MRIDYRNTPYTRVQPTLDTAPHKLRVTHFMTEAGLDFAFGQSGEQVITYRQNCFPVSAITFEMDPCIGAHLNGNFFGNGDAESLRELMKDDEQPRRIAFFQLQSILGTLP